MTDLASQIRSDLNNFLKAKDEVAVSALRLLLSNVHNAQIAKRDKLTDEEVAGEIAKDAKRHRESIEAYRAANRDDLVEKETRELAILEKYLPKQLSPDELSKIVDEEIKVLGAGEIKDMGRVMSAVMARVKGQADGALVSAIVKSKLSP